jgi:hypothetical protein
MLRQYAQQGSFTVADIDPDVMQQEVRDLLDLDQLGQWYARVARKDHPGFATRPVVGLQDKQVGVCSTQCLSRSCLQRCLLTVGIISADERGPEGLRYQLNWPAFAEGPCS